MSDHDSTETRELLARLEGGDRSALGALVDSYRGYLRKLLDIRMEDDLRARIDPSDVIQETQLVVTRRIEDYLLRRPATFRVWLRSTALESLVDLRRQHLAKKRSIHAETRLSGDSSLFLARQLLEDRPSRVIQQKELVEQVQQVIMELRPADQEILLLRNVENLSNAEAADVLSIEPGTARKRLGRAIVRLTALLAERGIELDG